MAHILERFFIHMISATFVTLGIYFALSYWLRTNAKVSQWISLEHKHLLVVSALIVFALLPLREPYDIWAGNNSIIKSCFDQFSWLLGASLAAWGLYRFKKE